MSSTIKPTRREERRVATVREIKQLAMDQISEGGPDAVSLSGIVREMSMSPAAIYRYFANRDALLADLVVDAYDDLADSLVDLENAKGSAESHLDAVLRGMRAWALKQPNAYRLIFQTRIGSGEEFAPERTIPASSRSMTVIINALLAVTGRGEEEGAGSRPAARPALADAFEKWAERREITSVPVDVLALAFLTWTRLHGIISLELGGHLAATGIGADVLFDAEVETIRSRAASLPPSSPRAQTGSVTVAPERGDTGE
ncbi:MULTISPECIES: TetR/AcrR family transcriptional regulator [unclassified Microbacterium]|uniref:TetR/AcrR family transcriptional regulator n=1 Tax=unclassified Microbacterium TaxID=2609290 RepID=UPI0037467686